MTVHLIELRSDVLRCFTTFYSVLLYLYTLTFVMLDCLLYCPFFFWLEFERPKRQIFILYIYYEQRSSFVFVFVYLISTISVDWISRNRSTQIRSFGILGWPLRLETYPRIQRRLWLYKPALKELNYENLFSQKGRLVSKSRRDQSKKWKLCLTNKQKSKHRKSYKKKERYVLWQNTTCKFSGYV